MIKSFVATFLFCGCSLLLLTITTTSCKKTVTNTVTDTLTINNTINHTDTLLAPSKDTVFAMDTSAWNLYSFATNALVSSGSSTYTNTSDGIQFFGQAYRAGSGFYPGVDDIWYYTRIVPTPNSYNVSIITSIGNYDNQGGSVILTQPNFIYATNTYIAIRIGDTYAGSSAYGVLGECKIVDN